MNNIGNTKQMDDEITELETPDFMNYFMKRANEIKINDKSVFDKDEPDYEYYNTGWMCPDGILYKCRYGEHEVKAEYLVYDVGFRNTPDEYKKCNDKHTRTLVSVGWLRISHTEVFGILKCSEKQKEAIGEKNYNLWKEMFGGDYFNF